MAASTITKTSYGFLVTGGTSATTITSDRIYIKRIVYIPAADAATCVLTDVNTISIFKTKGATAATAYIYDVGGEKGVNYKGIISTCSGTGDELHLIVF